MALTSVQTRIGVSDTGQLILVIPPHIVSYPDLGPTQRLPKSRATGASVFKCCSTEAHILQLPTELLQQCIRTVHDMDVRSSEDYSEEYDDEATVDSTDGESDHDPVIDDSPQATVGISTQYAAIYALSLTCKRLHALAVPMLYARPRFHSPTNEHDCSSQCDKFYNTIRRNPRLRPFVKHLSLQNMKLRHVPEQTCALFPSLESLLLVWPRDGDEDTFEGSPLPEEEGTANLTELRLRRVRLRPKDVNQFLKWPRRLQTFALDDVTYDGYDWEYTEPNPAFRWSHALLADALSPQRHNLQVLELGWMGYTRDQHRFDVSAFPNLRTLQLCVAYEEPTAGACQNWLTASLRTICLDLGKNDSQCGKGCSFGPGESKRVVNFAKLASAEKRRRPGYVGLEEIGFLAHHTNNDSWLGCEEWLCDHSSGNNTAVILMTLKAIEAEDFSAFWMGASGTKHTAQAIQEACSVCAGALQGS